MGPRRYKVHDNEQGVLPMMPEFFVLLGVLSIWVWYGKHKKKKLREKQWEDIQQIIPFQKW